MKKIALFGIMVLIIPLVLADYECMAGYGMIGSFGMGLYGILWFVIAAFVFSIIFWSVYRWIIKEMKENKTIRR